MKRVLILLAMLVVVAPLAAVPEPTAEELQVNRRRFEELRKHPERLEKLRADAKAYFSLPKDRRRQIAQIHLELHKESSTTQARLHGVLDRYVHWLEDVEDGVREKLAAAPDKKARLALIKDLREQEWVNDQPRAIREQLDKLQGADRQSFIAKEKADERRRRTEWVMAGRFWNELEGEAKGRPRLLPTRFAELSPPVQTYVNNYLMRMFLTAQEKEQLEKLEGQWPWYPMKLVELADKHPAALPGPVGPKSFADLPMRIYANKDFLREMAPKFLKKDSTKVGTMIAQFLKIPEGKWPEFGIELARVAKQRGHVFEHEFLAYNLDCLAAPMQDFMKNKLKPVLTGQESLRLVDANGKWPDYPQTIQELANNHHLQAPWYTLPRVENWGNYRLQR